MIMKERLKIISILIPNSITVPLLLLILLSACVTARIEDNRLGMTGLNEGEGIVIMAKSYHLGNETENKFISCISKNMRDGASGLRINDAKNIYNVKKKLDVPIIGIKKRKLKNSKVTITPFCEDIKSLANSGADIIAFDATLRKRPVEINKLIKSIHKNKLCVIGRGKLIKRRTS